MASTGGESRKRKKGTSVSDSEIIHAAHLLIQLSGSSDEAQLDEEEEEEEEEEEDSVGKTTVRYDHHDQDQVSSNSCPLKYMVFGDEEEDYEAGLGKEHRNKRFRYVLDLYKHTRPLENNGALVKNVRKRQMV